MQTPQHVPATSGWRQFRKVVDESTQAKVAKEMGVCQQTVSAYYKGRVRPSGGRRDRAEALYGIPRDDWYTAEERRAAHGEPVRKAG